MKLDHTDKELLKELQANARITNAELAKHKSFSFKHLGAGKKTRSQWINRPLCNLTR